MICVFCIELLICFFLAIFHASCIATTDPTHVNALISLHTAWSSNPSSWDLNTDPCDNLWLGVRCNNATPSAVKELILINQDLNGILPAEIGNLTELTDLDLSSNAKLGGSLPREIGKLTKLNRLFVQFCNFSGTIPDEIGNMTLVQYLGLTQNSFTGSIPPIIGQLKVLKWFDISSNNFSGTLPFSASSGSGLDNLTNAQHFHFQNNSFSGSIPPSIFHSQMHLKHLLLYENSFNGSIPSTIGDLPDVEIVRMDFNKLSGPIPPTISQLKNLATL